MKDKFKDSEFKMPEESGQDKKGRSQKMAKDLLTMINELKEEQEKSKDGQLKQKLHTAIESLEKLQGKVKKDIN